MKRERKRKFFMILVIFLITSIGSGTVFSQGTFSDTSNDAQESEQKAVSDEAQSEHTAESEDVVQNQEKESEEHLTTDENKQVNAKVLSDSAEDDSITPAKENYDISGTTLNGLKKTYLENLSVEQKQNIHLVIPAEITKINNNAFNYTFTTGCRFLSLDLSQAQNLKTIGTHAFDGSTALRGDLILPQGLETIGDYAFYNTGYDGRLDIPDSVINIGTSAFRQTNAYQGFKGTLILPSCLTSLGTVAFSNQKGITAVVFPKTLTVIPASAFRYTGISGVLTIPDTIKSVGDNAFSDTNLNAVYLPKEITISASSFSKASYIVCADGSEYTRLKPISSSYKFGYETDVKFQDKENSSYSIIHRLYGQPYNIIQQDDKSWEQDTSYKFPAVKIDSSMRWGTSASAIAPVKESDIVNTAVLQAIAPLATPDITYSDKIDKVYDGKDSLFTVTASHPLAKPIALAKENDVVFYYTWRWNTIGSSPSPLTGFDKNTYQFKGDVRSLQAISVDVTVQACRVNNANKAVVFHTENHTFEYNVQPAEPVLHLQYEKIMELTDTLPIISSLDDDTPGTLVWDEGQQPQLGTHSYAWTFTPEKNAEGQYNYKTVKGTSELTFVRYHTLTIQKAEHGQVQTDTQKPIQGQELILTFVPDKGCHVNHVFINGVDYTDKVKNNRLTLTVQEDLDVQTAFEKIKAEDIQEGITSLPQNGEVLNEEEQQTVLDVLSEYTQLEDRTQSLSEQVKETLLETMQKHPRISIDMNKEKMYASSLTPLLDELKETDIQLLQNEKQANISIHMDVSAQVDKKEQELLKEHIQNSKLELAYCYDVKILKTLTTATDEQSAELKQLTKPIRLTFSIPQELYAPDGVNREYYILRIHEEADGTPRVDVLETEHHKENEISVYSDRFSTYAIAYRDSLIQPNQDPQNPIVTVDETFTITAKKEGRGSMTPEGTAVVKAGTNAVYTWKPENGYHVQDVVVDGKSTGTPNSYTFESVNEDHTIRVLFEKNVDEAVKRPVNEKEQSGTAETEKSASRQTERSMSSHPADTSDSTRNEIWLLAILVSMLAMLGFGVVRYKRK